MDLSSQKQQWLAKLFLRQHQIWSLTIFLSGAVVSAMPAQAPVSKIVGTVKAINGNAVTLTPATGPDVIVTFADSARITLAAPGQADLQSAPSIAVSGIEIGDRIFARGQAGEGNTVVASSAILMRKSDIEARKQQEREEWRKGVGGIVKSVDAAAGTVAITNAMAESGKPIIIHVAPETIIRRYAPDSIKFDDAKPGTLDQIKSGDQLRARGSRNPDGTEFTAQAIVSGSFRDIAGTVVSTDAVNNRITVMDLTVHKPVLVNVTADSQLHKLPPFAAQMMAQRLQGGVAADSKAQNPPLVRKHLGNPIPKVRRRKGKAQRMPKAAPVAVGKGDPGAGATGEVTAADLLIISKC